jgi:AhpD family alkylhydroperoxidase
VTRPLQGGSLDAGLIALLELRASQINGCLLCVQLGVRSALHAAVAAEKIERVGTWRCADVFSHAEKAALSWAEHRAGNSEQSTSDAVWSNCRKHFSEPQIAELLEYWSSSALWSSDAVIRCCAAGMAVNPLSVGTWNRTRSEAGRSRGRR